MDDSSATLRTAVDKAEFVHAEKLLRLIRRRELLKAGLLAH